MDIRSRIFTAMDTPQEVAISLVSAHNLTDEEIARRIGSTQPTVWRVRTGKTKNCSADLYLGLLTLRAELENKCATAGADTTATEAHQEAA